MKRMLALVLAMSLFAQAGLARAEDWAPPEPMPDEFDWIQMSSGEWLKGEIKVLYKESMEFDSDELGLLTLDIGDIKVIRSAQTLSVRSTDNRTATGQLLLEGETAQVIGETTETFDRGEVIAITAGVPKERNFWAGKVSLGANLRSGNTDQTEFSGNAKFQRRTVKNRIIFNYLGSFSETKVPNATTGKKENVQTANNHRLTGVWDYFLSERWFLRPLSGEYYRDPFQNIAHRWTIGTGIGYQIIDTSKIDWQVFAGPSYVWTKYEDVEEGASDTDDSVTLSAGTIYNHELTDWIDFVYDYRFQFGNEDIGRYTHHMLAGFSFELIGDLDFDFSLIWDRVEEPRPYPDPSDPNDPPSLITPEKDDYRLVFGLGYSF